MQAEHDARARLKGSWGGMAVFAFKLKPEKDPNLKYILTASLQMRRPSWALVSPGRTGFRIYYKN